MPRYRYAIRLLYHGGPFRGFQRQAGLPTVQDALAAALAASGVQAAAMAVGARTDAGVHALAQVVSFATRWEIGAELLRRQLNRALPDGILCREARRVPLSFHARASARARRYVYLLGTPAPEGLSEYAWSLPDRRAFPGVERAALDVPAMREALASAIGRHDFVGFARRGVQRDTVRELLHAELLVAVSDPVIAIVLEGTGFLRAMVRNLVGTVVTVGLGLAEASTVGDILRGRARYRGVRAPGWGLTLAAVDYPPSAWGEERLPEGA